jgi:hypothetical protein
VAQASPAGGLVEAAQRGQLGGEAAPLVTGLDQAQPAGAQVILSGASGVYALILAPLAVLFHLGLIAGDGARRGVAGGHVQAQENGESGAHFGPLGPKLWIFVRLVIKTGLSDSL